RRRSLRRVLVEQRRHRRAEVVDVSGQHEGRAQPCRDVHAGARQRDGLARPARVDRVGRVNHDRGAAGLARQRFRLLDRRCEMPRARGQRRRGATRLRQHLPACIGERTGGNGAEAAVGAQDQDCAGGGVHDDGSGRDDSTGTVWAYGRYSTIAGFCNRAIQFRMPMDRFDWALVRSFVAVLDAGSLTGAARALGAQQPTLSRHIAELEAQLGAPLFERTGRGVTPAAAALAIADAARQMEAGAHGLVRAVSGLGQATSGKVRITTSQVAAAWLLPPILAALQDEEPAIQVELVASNALSNLLRREADIAVRMVRPTQGALVARRIAEIGVGAYAHERYLAAAGVPRRPADLLRHRLVGFDLDDTIIRGFARLGVPIA